MRHPILTEFVHRESGEGNNDEIYLKYGIYNSYVSNWLYENKTKEVQVKGWDDAHEKNTGFVISSKTNDPFSIDWGVEIPKQVIYFDEIRLGNSREEVDVTAITKPVD